MGIIHWLKVFQGRWLWGRGVAGLRSISAAAFSLLLSDSSINGACGGERDKWGEADQTKQGLVPSLPVQRGCSFLPIVRLPGCLSCKDLQCRCLHGGGVGGREKKAGDSS